VSEALVCFESDGSDLWRQNDDQGTDVLSAQLDHELVARADLWPLRCIVFVSCKIKGVIASALAFIGVLGSNVRKKTATA